jgi:prepilin-type N-terminal cleavage/methylation domain-containing protein
MRNHRGFTLVEILISLVIMSLVTGAIYGLLATTQRVSRAQTERTELQSNIRTGAIIVPAELREINVMPTIDPNQTDIIALNGTSIQYRAMRGLGYTCQTPAALGNEVVLFQSTFTGYPNPPEAGRDAAYVFHEGANAHFSSDDVWVPVTISQVQTGPFCPGGVAGIKLTITPIQPLLLGAGIGAPVRTWEWMELKLYSSGGDSWLGARSVSAGELAPQPVLGPLRDVDGFTLVGLDSLGAQTTVNNKVRSILVTLRGLTDQAITNGTSSRGLAHMQDSLITQVTLRNALR